ncbi:uncharacterized protein LOC125498550 [Beta vulgaris subsp. vulgaris]|uniref:uncharacterized protein LOC125498550 n=1 Tax=Beta vulgaris subsp. vulgaris TaxID=3555 RepID=UPI002037330D|nr:uncharacterized protein LOC125498550 [Beta vulgaris subsp. vulgaris]
MVRDYCIQCGFSVVVDKASNFKYTVRCSDDKCEWKLHASKLPDGSTWAIKSIQNQEHTCLGLETRNPMVSSAWASRVLMEDIRANNDISAKSMNKLLWDRFRVEMSISTLYRMRTMTLLEIHGAHYVSYGHLPKYCEVVKSTNPGSAAFCAWKPPNDPEKPLAFVSIFIAFRGALDELFAGCRSFIGVDGTFLKGHYGGVLLSAVALDGNNDLFPFAWAIVSGEDNETWKFFVWHLKNVLQDSGRGDEWCIISDRHKSIEAAFSALWPKVGRRYCCKHLASNWKKAHPGPLMFSLFWKACGATSTFTFKKAMDQIQKVNPQALVWLSKLGEQSRSTKHKFNPNIKCDMNKSNFVESFNATLGTDRCRPVLTLLEGIRRVTMVRLATRRQVCEEWERDDVCPNILKRIQVLKEPVKHISLMMVNMRLAILHAGLDPLKFIDDMYTVKVYKLAYAQCIKSVPDFEQWPDIDLPTIQPPTIKRKASRPCRNRKRGEDEARKGKRSCTVQCKKCKSFGHNARTCKGGPTNAQTTQRKTKGKQAKQQATSKQ